MSNDLSNKISQLAAKIDAQTEKARRTQVITIVVGIVFIVLLLGYFTFMSKLTRESLEPSGVATVIADKTNQHVKGLNKEALAWVKQEVPKIANESVTNVLNETLPSGRKSLEASIKTESTKLLQRYEDEIYKGVDDTLAKYSENIKEFATQLKTEEGTQAFSDALYKVIDEAVTTEDMQIEMQTYGEALASIDHTLNTLVNGTELTEEQVALRHLLQVIREITRRSELNKLSLGTSETATP